MKYVNIYVGEETIIFAGVRRKKFFVGCPFDVFISSKGKEVKFYYNIDNIPNEVQEKLKEFTNYIKAQGNFFSKEMTHPVTNTDSYSIEIPKNYKFKIENK